MTFVPSPRYFVVLALTLPLACKGDDVIADGGETGSGSESESGETAETGDEDFVDAEFLVRESVRQLQITHAQPGVELRVLDGSGAEVGRATADALGSLIFRELVPGDGYAVEETGPVPREAARDLLVWGVEESYPEQSFYDAQVLEPGFNYIMTRDGTMLSAYVTLPGPIEDGPYPTIVNYSGYEPSKPGSSLADQFDVGGLDIETLCPTFPVICDAPGDPSAILGGFFGFATVGVNMRGTGCSGGAYDYFEDAAAPRRLRSSSRPWPRKTGCYGHKRGHDRPLSYPGISQLFVAKTQPPSLVGDHTVLR